MTASSSHARTLATWVLCLSPCFVSGPANADDVSELRQSLEALRAENRALAARLLTLEAQGSVQRGSTPTEATALTAPVASTPTAADARTAQRLEQRVQDLESAKVAQEDAVRSIVRTTVDSLESKFKNVVSLSGNVGVTLGQATDFSGERKGSLALSTADLELELKSAEWVRGILKIEYVDGKDVLFPTTTGNKARVDRLTLDSAYVTVGDVSRFPPLLTAGRFVLPFGSSTGHPVADVLSITSPLTVDVFEMRKNAVSLGLFFPTRAPEPPTPGVVVPPVLPQWVQPRVAQMSGNFGYRSPSTRLKRLAAQEVPIDPPFTAGVYLFDGSTPGGLSKHVGAHLGYQTHGNCGRYFEDLTGAGLCPWKAAVGLGYNSSIFNSRFLETQYAAFIDEIGRVPGVSATLKARLGRFALVGEWNSAARPARFSDDAGTHYAIKPQAWQVSLGYQFGWNPWIQDIGTQGTYMALGFSQSRDLGGVFQLVNGASIRVGSVPKRRIILTAGEWLHESLRLAVEYSHDLDYSPAEGGTGKTARSLFTTLTYAW